MGNFWRKMFGGEVDETSDVEFDDIDRPEEASGSTAESLMKPEGNGGELPVELLDAILAVINAELPPVAAHCIDREAQRRYLATALGEPLASFGETLKRRAISELTGDRARIQSELDELKAERKEVAAKREEQKAALLSEQRQRRALSDRNRDLEAKIDELASEIEQHKLTISSLMNKLRVAEVNEEDSKALRSDLETLRTQLAEKTDENTALGERLAELEAASAVEAALRNRREAAGEETTDEQQPDSAAPKKRRGRPRKQSKTPYDSADDDTSTEIEGAVDWLLPGGVPAGHTPPASDPDFGYQPPKQAPAPDSDSQLTLF